MKHLVTASRQHLQRPQPAVARSVVSLAHICHLPWLVAVRGYRYGYRSTARRIADQGALRPAAPPETEMTMGISDRRRCRDSKRRA